ncbi:MFS transporter [Halorussus sp. AFM4]|uniref:MFS transporter n=1 Tax=Halorussus sp. AFM4 TaxID=3421651 RepID=UPI003EB78596
MFGGLRRRAARRVPHYGWVVVAACFAITLVVFGLSYSFGVFFERILATFGASRASTSAVFAVQTFVVYVGAAAVGGVVDRVGPRVPTAIGAGLLTVGLLATARADSLLGVVLAYGVVAGLGLSALYVVAYATVPRWFDRRRGLAVGVTTSGLGIGMLVVAPLAAASIRRVGWRATYLALVAGFVALLAVAAAFVARDPTDAGIETDAGGEVRAEVADGGPGPDSDPGPWREQAGAVADVARTPAFGLLFAGWVCTYAALYVLLTHGVAFLGASGFPRWVGAWTIGTVGGVTSLARLGVGYLSDRLGRARVFVACSATMGVATLGLTVAPTPALVLGSAALFGVGYGGNGALLSPLTADLFGTENLNAVFGLMSAAFAVAGLVAPTAAGYVADTQGTYAPAFVASGLLALVGAGLVAGAARVAPEV